MALQGFLQELQALDRNLVPGWLNPAPNCRCLRDYLNVGGERLDDHVAPVTNVIKGFGDAFPVDVIPAGGAAIAATSMEMCQRFTRFSNGRCLVLLLDVHV